VRINRLLFNHLWHLEDSPLH